MVLLANMFLISELANFQLISINTLDVDLHKMGVIN